MTHYIVLQKGPGHPIHLEADDFNVTQRHVTFHRAVDEDPERTVAFFNRAKLIGFFELGCLKGQDKLKTDAET